MEKILKNYRFTEGVNLTPQKHTDTLEQQPNGTTILTINAPFELECGAILPVLDIAFHTYGTLNATGDNVIWIGHALTANSDAADWWSGLVGEGKFFDPNEHFIVCANMIGSHYGSTSPLSINPQTNRFYGRDFPVISVRDVAKAHHLLAQHLGIQRIKLGLGGSMGGQQILEWAIQEPTLFEKIVLIACGAKMTPWSVALNETQRMALEADPSVTPEKIAAITDVEELKAAGGKGMEAARAIGMLSYRSYEGYNIAQQDDRDLLDTFKVQSYQRYQGNKLRQRFSAVCYFSVSKTMDSHHVGRNRGGIVPALQRIQADTLVIGITSDLLFPLVEQRVLAAHIPKSQLKVIHSKFGHDGFLIEFDQLFALLSQFFKKEVFA
jgi:homoserine O-acetyltransferase/O-succinyltransferase